ncbi:MAG: 4Fe-4S binding protein [Deltaproteobacteria bacterium]|nr:4Fe-4S binding protein [Deltaproteobacteria bacterium]
MMSRILRWTLQTTILGLFAAYIALPDKPVPGEIVFRADALAIGIAALAGRALFLSLVFSLVLLVITFLMGRVFCGWACPLGAITDFIDFVIGRKPAFQALRRVKYHLLIAFTCIAVFGTAIAWYLDPMAWASRIGTLFAPPISMDWAMFLAVTGLLVFLEIILGRRGFCRVLCPLGALIGVVASVSPFSWRVGNSCTSCGKCSRDCRMAAIDAKPEKHSRAECVHCRDCVRNCPDSALGLGYFSSPLPVRPDPLRRQYLFSLGGGAAVGALLRGFRTNLQDKAIHPPGAIPRDKLAAQCVRCGACIRVCPTKCLEPALDEAGPLLFQAPVLNARKAGCAFECNECGKICPSGAIIELTLPEKQKEKIGIAVFDRTRCVTFAKNSPCVVCHTSCPVSAIEFIKTDITLEWGETLYRPRIVKNNCIGCGLCEAICPLGGDAGVHIKVLDE